jgi:hypothetical protein
MSSDLLSENNLIAFTSTPEVEPRTSHRNKLLKRLGTLGTILISKSRLPISNNELQVRLAFGPTTSHDYTQRARGIAEQYSSEERGTLMVSDNERIVIMNFKNMNDLRSYVIDLMRLPVSGGRRNRKSSKSSKFRKSRKMRKSRRRY